LIQSLALQPSAEEFTGDIKVVFQNQEIVIADQDNISDELKGYVKLALDLGILTPYISVEQGPFDLEPTFVAKFKGGNVVSRGVYAVAATRFFDTY
ncbi:MAG: serine protease AprX, partial [Cognaticolwellia sp.]